jgi:succinyl-diaminopimelate desuccinylase
LLVLAKSSFRYVWFDCSADYQKIKMPPTLDLAIALLARPSITPDDVGCQALLAKRLEAIGFVCEPINVGKVSNLWARRRGSASGQKLVFAGHTDVVPPGPNNLWSSPPFEPVVEKGKLFARGSSDMKGAIAAFVVACEEFLKVDSSHKVDIGLLLTSDEEGVATDGTVRVVDLLEKRGELIDFCLVGEPTSVAHFGDVMKIGRRGSLTGHLVVKGVQGHVAYPQLALNSVHVIAPVIAQLVSEKWDDGDAEFPPTTFQVSNINAGTGATNMIPASTEIVFNFRFSPLSTVEQLTSRVERVLTENNVEFELNWTVGARPFIKHRGRLAGVLEDCVREIAGITPRISTSGGTSDARFLSRISTEIVEFGLPGGTAHQIDEHIFLKDLERLKDVYRGVLEAVVR